MKIEIELTKDDILEEVYKNYCGDTDLLVRLVDKGTSNWPQYMEVIISLLDNLLKHQPNDYDTLITALNANK